MRADGKDIFKARFRPILHLVVMKIADMLPQVIQAPKSVGSTVKFAILAGMLGFLVAEGLKMTIENVKSGEQSSALAPVRLMLRFLRMSK